MKYVTQRWKPPSQASMRELFFSITEQLQRSYLDQVQFALGFAWAIELEEFGWDWHTCSPAKLRSIILDAEYSRIGFVGDDDIYVNIAEWQIELHFSHHNLLSITCPNDSLHYEGWIKNIFSKSWTQI